MGAGDQQKAGTVWERNYESGYLGKQRLSEIFILRHITGLASFPGLPCFCCSVCVWYNTWKHRSYASVYYTECKATNKNRGGLRMRLVQQY